MVSCEVRRVEESERERTRGIAKPGVQKGLEEYGNRTQPLGSRQRLHVVRGAQVTGIAGAGRSRPLLAGAPGNEARAMLTEAEVERIRQGVRNGARSSQALTWVAMLLQDRDDRVARDREIAVRLLSESWGWSDVPPPAPPLRALRSARQPFERAQAEQE